MKQDRSQKQRSPVNSSGTYKLSKGPKVVTIGSDNRFTSQVNESSKEFSLQEAAHRQQVREIEDKYYTKKTESSIIEEINAENNATSTYNTK